jgi:hypothetical protein
MVELRSLLQVGLKASIQSVPRHEAGVGVFAANSFVREDGLARSRSVMLGGRLEFPVAFFRGALGDGLTQARLHAKGHSNPFLIIQERA